RLEVPAGIMPEPRTTPLLRNVSLGLAPVLLTLVLTAFPFPTISGRHSSRHFLSGCRLVEGAALRVGDVEQVEPPEQPEDLLMLGAQPAQQEPRVASRHKFADFQQAAVEGRRELFDQSEVEDHGLALPEVSEGMLK